MAGEERRVGGLEELGAHLTAYAVTGLGGRPLGLLRAGSLNRPML